MRAKSCVVTRSVLGQYVAAEPLECVSVVGEYEIINRDSTGAETYGYACTRCAAPHPAKQRRCGSCHAHYTVLPTDHDASPETLAARHTLATTAAVPENRIPTRIDWLDAALAGGISDYACVLLAGGEGGGKTTLALMALAQWPGRPPLLISTEQSSSELSAYATRLGMRRDAFVYGEEHNVRTARHAIRLAKEHRAGAVLLDSVSDLEDEDARTSGIKQFKNWAAAARVPVILVSQLNAKGEAEGRRKRRHDVTMYCLMWRAENPRPESADLRFFVVKKTRHSSLDAVVITLRKQPDGRLAFEQPAVDVPPPAPPAPPVAPAPPARGRRALAAVPDPAEPV